MSGFSFFFMLYYRYSEGGREMSNRIKIILEEYVNGLFEMIGEHLKQVILYGSYARGEQDKNGEISDIDIMILVDLENEEIRRLEEKVIDYSYDLDLKYDILLSPIIENIENFKDRTRYMSFYKNIESEGVLLNG